MKKLFGKYRKVIRDNCMHDASSSSYTVAYWQDRFFTNIVEIIVPLSVLTVMPGFVYSVIFEMPLVALYNILSLSLVLIIAFSKTIRLTTRKFLLMGITYTAALYTLAFIGFKGPGFLFLYSACVFGILILPVKFAYMWSYINVAVVGIFTFFVHFNLSPVEDINQMTGLEWIAISMNLLFLSFLTSAFLPRLFKGLSENFDRQKALQLELAEKNKNLELTSKHLAQKSSDMEQFAYLASHDMQEPLRMVTNFLTQLDKKYNEVLDEKGKQYIHFAVDGAKRMRQIITDLLEFSRVGRLEDEQKEIELMDIVDEVVQSLDSEIKEKNARINYSDLPVVHSYHSPLVQIVQNLVSNALKYAKEDVPPVIRIFSEQKDNEWIIHIEDNGIGMEEDYFDKIFLLFQRLHGRDQFSGTGMGLAIVKKYIEAMGGRIWVHSTPGDGSTFSFTLKEDNK